MTRKKPRQAPRGAHATRYVRRDELRKLTQTVNVTRDEFTQAVVAIQQNVTALEVQFRRIAQIQVELDEVKRLVAKFSST